MTHFLSTYRWELWLVIGIPAIAWVMGYVALLPFVPLLGASTSSSTTYFAASSIVSLLLLAVSYPLVRGPDREFLTLLWGYFVFASAIWTIMAVALVITSVD